MPAAPVTRRPNKPVKRTKPGSDPDSAVTPKVRIAVEAMTLHALTRAEAAKKAGFSESALYQALRKPAVMALFHEQMKVLREGARARNFHVLEQIRDTSSNDMAKVAAIKVLEPDRGQPGVQVNVGVSVTPGYVIDLSRPRTGPVIDHHEPTTTNTLIPEQDVGSDDDPTR